MTVGKIGNITHTIYPEWGNDEVVFNVPITNISSKEQCFILKLFNEAGVYVAKAPTSIIPGQMANKIKPGATEVMVLDSRGDFWHINDVDGQKLSFKLFADQSFLTTCGYFDSSYTEDVSKEFSIVEHTEEDIEAAIAAAKGLGVLITILAIAYIASQAAKFR